LTAKDLNRAVEVLQADTFSTLFDYDTPRDAKVKRLVRVVMRSKHFCQAAMGVSKVRHTPFLTLSKMISLSFSRRSLFSHWEVVSARTIGTGSTRSCTH